LSRPPGLPSANAFGIDAPMCSGQGHGRSDLDRPLAARVASDRIRHVGVGSRLAASYH